MLKPADKVCQCGGTRFVTVRVKGADGRDEVKQVPCPSCSPAGKSGGGYLTK